MIDFIGLELIQFHDLPLNSIRIHSEPEAKLEIEISVYDEERSEYQANLEPLRNPQQILFRFEPEGRDYTIVVGCEMPGPRTESNIIPPSRISY